jgi:hypothetical protein
MTFASGGALAPQAGEGYNRPVPSILLGSGDAMNQERPGVVQRAFEIARSGKVATVADLHAVLAREGYDNARQSLSGRSVSSQLTRMIAEARIGK